MITEVTKEVQEKAIKDLLSRFEAKRNKKGRLSFNSIWEIYGKLQEENFEALQEVHGKDVNMLYDELNDVAITALWGMMSIKAWEK